jgi:hypothetical protein
MTRIVADLALRRQLNGLKSPVEVCDESGRTMGHYLPEADYKALLYSTIDLPLSQEEITRRRQERGGRTLSEIWKSLGQR